MENLRINDREFQRIKVRNHEGVEIYKGAHGFLKIGGRQIIEKEKTAHERLLSLGFPVASILESGEIGTHAYFIEESMGDQHFGEIFAKDCRDVGEIRKDNFDSFISVVSQYAEAQLRERYAADVGDFPDFIRFEEILAEMPALTDLSRLAMARVQKSLRSLPAVLTHGDFNPHNIFPKGCIDLERVAKAPAGYDIVPCVLHIRNFPQGEGFEMSAEYSFSAEQIQEYSNVMDEIYARNELGPISKYRNEFIFCRNIWSAVRMQKWPKLQSWRYERYKKILSDFLADRDLSQDYQ